jgi:hypothetical protein
MVYFNNCHARDHAKIYGSGAFYDLNTTGFQATKAKNLPVGERCIVATPSKDGKILFAHFSFVSELVRQDDTGRPYRVFLASTSGPRLARRRRPLARGSICPSLIRTAISKDIPSLNGRYGQNQHRPATDQAGT